MALKLRLILIVLLLAGGALLASPVSASGRLLKSNTSPAVYYLDQNNTRHLFVTESIYKSWYDDFSRVEEISEDDLSGYRLGQNITLRPGRIAKFDSLKKYYLVQPGGVLALLDSESVTKEIFGARWSSRVVRLSDAFFGNYTLGETIKYAHQLPDGLVYKDKVDGKYYYKDNDLLQPFKNLESVFASSFKTSDIIVQELTFDKRQKIIDGFSEKIFNPIAAAPKSTADCENKKFKVAFLFVTKGGYTKEQVNKINLLKDRAAANFKLASRGLAELDTSWPLTILSDHDYLFFTDYDGQAKPHNEVINSFFDSNPDQFDFIVLFNNFVAKEPVIANYLVVNNDFLGTGQAQIHTYKSFGSQGKLKGIANMGNLAKYSVDNNEATNSSVNLIFHELLHHFSGKAKFLDDQGQVDLSLLAGQNHDHWSRYLDAVSPLGGSGWLANGDGSYTSKTYLDGGQSLVGFSDLDLYFMGLLPKFLVAPIRYLVPSDPARLDNTITGQLAEISIDKIIAAMGQWRCQLQ